MEELNLVPLPSPEIPTVGEISRASSRHRLPMLPVMATVGPEPPLLVVRVLGTTLRWAPVWVPALLFWQITSHGLTPALAEQKRLDGARPEVEARHTRTTSEFERMSAERTAWDDPVYLERKRRARASSGPATDGLEHADD